MGKNLKHGYCCREAKHLSCEIQCLTSKNVSHYNDENCNSMREPQLAQCLKRIDISKNCCQNGDSLCRGTCEKYFRSSASAALFMHKQTLETACGRDSQTYKCAMDNTKIHSAVKDYNTCCSQGVGYACERRCREVLSNSDDYSDTFDALRELCGKFDLSDPMYKCLLTTSTYKIEKEEKIVKSHRTTVMHDKGSSTFKQQCCDRAKSVKCNKWCLATMKRPNLMALWDTMYMTCIQHPKEAALSTCMSDILEPCKLGGSTNLDFCTNFNDRPLELFRRFNDFGDSAAQKLHKFWSDGIVPVLEYKLIFKDIKTCQPEMFKALACLTAIKPCDHKIIQRQVCRKDCEELLSDCLDRSLTTINIRMEIDIVCAAILPKDNQSECISVKDYVKKPTQVVDVRSEVTLPCNNNPCKRGEVCMINHSCKRGRNNCKPYSCVKGCTVSPKSNLVIPVDQMAKLSTDEGRNNCFQICQCKKTWVPSDTQLLYYFGLCKKFGCYENLSCTADGKTYKDGQVFTEHCNTCTCSDGDIICTEKDCQLNLTANVRPRRHHHDDGQLITSDDSCDCMNVYKPLCGTNGMTYANSCHAKCCHVDDRTLDVGDCQQTDPCVPNPCPKDLKCMPSKHVCLSPWTACPQYTCHLRHVSDNTTCVSENEIISHEVCGFDGVTYKNSCLLEKFGTGIDYKGPCLPKQYQDLDGAVERCSKISCEPINPKHCHRIRIPGTCCLVCGSTMRVIYSQRDLLRHHNFISFDHFTIPDIVIHLRQLLQVSECRLYAHMLVPGELVIAIIVESKHPTYSQFVACRTEAERLNKYINHKSPILNTNYYLSVLKASRLKTKQWITSNALTLHRSSVNQLLLVCVIVSFIMLLSNIR